jgi:hypothetical protein
LYSAVPILNEMFVALILVDEGISFSFVRVLEISQGLDHWQDTQRY